jgi:DNA polymerase III gamma/tau subunit
MRDSQSLLDQAVSYSGMEIGDEDLQATLGSVAQATLSKFTAGLLSRDAAELLTQVDALLEQGQDMRQFLAGVVEHLRNLLVVKIASAPAQIIELPASDIEVIKQQAASTEAERLLMLFDSLSKTLDDLRWSPHQRFTLEVGLIKACNLSPLKPLADVLAHVKELEARLATGHLSTIAPPTGISEPRASYTTAPKTTAPSSQPVAAARGGEHGDLWGKVMSALKMKKPGLASFLAHSRLMELSDMNLVIGVQGGFRIEQVEKPENRGIIERCRRDLGRNVQVRVRPLADSNAHTTSRCGKKNRRSDPMVGPLGYSARLLNRTTRTVTEQVPSTPERHHLIFLYFHKPPHFVTKP